MTPVLAVIPFLMQLLVVLWVLVALALILIVLIQKGKGGGLSAAFGGAGASSLLGTKTGDFLTWLTICLVALFLVLAVVMGKFLHGKEPEGLAAPAAQQQPAAPAEQPATDSGPSLPAEQTPPQSAPQAPAAEQTAPAGAAADSQLPAEQPPQ